jgi:hypothetical protein
MAVFLFSFSEMVNAQSYAREKYSKIMWNHLEVLSGFGPRYVGTKGYSKTLRLIRRVGAEFADGVIEHSFFVKQPGGGQKQMTNVEFVFLGLQRDAYHNELLVKPADLLHDHEKQIQH